MMMSFVIGIVSGIVASLFVWVLISRWIIPKLTISPHINISMAVADKNANIYKVLITNNSNRDVYDIVLFGRLFLFGLIPDRPNEERVYVARVGTGNHPYLPKEQNRNSRRFLVKPTKQCTKQVREIYREFGKKFDLKEILEKNSDNYLEISVICSHGFSGARKIITQRYKATDII